MRICSVTKELPRGSVTRAVLGSQAEICIPFGGMNKLPQSQSSSKQRVVLSQDVTGRAAAYHVCLNQLPLPHGLENPSCGLKLLPHIGNVSQVFSVLASSSVSCEDGLCFPQLLALWQGFWRSLKKDCLSWDTAVGRADHRLRSPAGWGYSGWALLSILP